MNELSLSAVSYAVKINGCWRRTRDDVFQLGDLLLEAKAALDGADFDTMVETGLDFQLRTAQRLMAIARDPRLRNTTHVSLLPTSWGTLYELTRLDDDTFYGCVADGTIKPDMERIQLVTRLKKATRIERERELGERQAVAKIADEQEWPEHAADMALHVGRAAEHLVCADALMRGWNAFQASQGSPYDVVLEKGGRMLRVQVKGAQRARNVNSQGSNERLAYSFAALRRGSNGEGPRLTKHHADLLACVALDIGAIAYLPISECSSTVQLEPDVVTENRYVRTYDRPIRQYPLENAVARIDNEEHYVQLQKIFAAFPRRRFGVIYADCPWSFSTWSEAGKDRSADNHYPTINTDVLCGVGPYIPASEDSALFLWATSPMLPDAVKVMAAWGFSYRSNLVWEKRRDTNTAGLASTQKALGTGFWFRNAHELLLLGTRGAIPAPAPGQQWASVLEATVGKHSAKPDCVCDMIEEYFPSLPKLEMFRRGQPRKGWEAWGNEAEAAE